MIGRSGAWPSAPAAPGAASVLGGVICGRPVAAWTAPVGSGQSIEMLFAAGSRTISTVGPAASPAFSDYQLDVSMQPFASTTERVLSERTSKRTGDAPSADRARPPSVASPLAFVVAVTVWIGADGSR